MSKDTTDTKSHGDMVRDTADNLKNLLFNVGNHIDYLEKQVVALKDRVTELERSNDDLK